MGYCMSWDRMCRRNSLSGDYQYSESGEDHRIPSIIAGDLRRIERDTRDAKHLAWYAAETGLAEEQIRHVFDLFFDRDCWVGPASRPPA